MHRIRTSTAAEPERLAGLQRFLRLTLLVGIAGMGSELVLIGHVENRPQLVPIARLPAGLIGEYVDDKEVARLERHVTIN